MQQQFPATGQLARQQTGQLKGQTFPEIQYQPGSCQTAHFFDRMPH